MILAVSLKTTLSQIGAVVEKDFIEKKRTPRVTLCEFLSHVIIIMLLVFGHHLATVEPVDETEYYKISLSVPLSLDDITTILKGPLPTLTLGEFVALGTSIHELVKDDEEFSNALKFFSEYDNLLYLGTMHFAPKTSATLDLMEYINSTYATVQQTIPFMLHETEDQAINYILDHLEERALCLVVLTELDEEGIRYKIRMNYTTLPNTNKIVDELSVGLNTNYQLYALSGFMSVKDSVDRWVFNYSSLINASLVYDLEVPTNRLTDESIPADAIESETAEATIKTPCERPRYAPYDCYLSMYSCIFII
jgi:hypothetical protein